MRFTEDSIAFAVATQIFPWRRYVVVPNISWGLLPYEADLVACSDAGWLSEVEIKISKADFLHDKEKPKHDIKWTASYPAIVSEFYYAMPSAVWQKCKPEDLPDGAGLILCGEHHKGNGVTHCFVEQKPKSRAARKLSNDERFQLMRLGYIRYWCRQNAVERLLEGIHRTAERDAETQGENP